MQYANLGKSGLKVSRLSLGMMTYGTSKWRPWVLDEDASRPFIKKALDAGINFFDTADIYSNGVSEELTGKFLRELGVKRESIVIATKVFFNLTDEINASGLSRKHIMDGIDASLKRLGMDYVDLYQIHRWDNETPIEETMEPCMMSLKQGKRVISVLPRCTPGSSQRRSRPPIQTAGHVLSPCRITITWSTAKKSAR